MLIDYTYLSGKLNLPQTGNTEGRTIVESFINTYETEYLKKVLCYDLWKAFTSGITGSDDPDEKWADLLNGKEFEYNGRNYKWDGFTNDELKSPIANYVYYRYMEDQASDNTLVGTAAQNVDNNSRKNAVSKMIDAWNSMVEMNIVLSYFLKANAETYPEWENCECGEVFNYKNSFDL